MLKTKQVSFFFWHLDIQTFAPLMETRVFKHGADLGGLLLKNSSSPFILISSSQRSMTLFAPFVVFPTDCLFTCIFHSL